MLCMLLSKPEPWLLPSASQLQVYTMVPIPKLLTSTADLTLHAAPHHAAHALLSHHPQSNPARPDWYVCLLERDSAAAVAMFSTAVVAAERGAADWSAPANTKTESVLEVGFSPAEQDSCCRAAESECNVTTHGTNSGLHWKELITRHVQGSCKKPAVLSVHRS